MAKHTNGNKSNKSNKSNKGAKANKSNANANTGSANAINETPEIFSLVDNMTETTETPTAETAGKGKGKGTASKPAAGVVKQKDNGFAVLSTQMIRPEFLEFVPELSGRSAPVADSLVVELAESLRTQGQQQAIQVRATKRPGYFAVVFGNTRARAAQLLVSGYALSETKRVEGNPDFMLRAEVVDCDDETAFTHNVIENAARTQCTAIDNAKNQARLRDEFGMSDVAIAKLYGYASSASVSRLKGLLTLPQAIQDAIHTGDCTQAAGTLLVDFSKQKIHGAEVTANDVETVYLYAVDAAGKGEPVNADAVTAGMKRIRAARAPAKPEVPTSEPGTEGTTGEVDATAVYNGTAPSEPGTAPSEPGTAPSADEEPRRALTVKQFKDSVAEIAADPKCPQKLANVLTLTLNFANGQIDAPAYAKALAQLIG